MTADQVTRWATFIRNLTDWTGEARLYRVEPPITDEDGKKTEFVVVSATVAYSGPETYIFPADESGEVTDWGEMDGSFRGELNHEGALLLAGYRTVT